jgi:para-aminobenzoate synthetase / 4-amino-4-deoxychorismate lyase
MPGIAQTEPFALFDDATWPDRPAMLLSGSRGLIEAWTTNDVEPALAAVEAGVARGLTAAGYCAYELGYAFEKRLQPLMPALERPLLRFHLFDTSERFDARARTRWLADRAGEAFTDASVIPTLDEAGHRAKVARVRQLIGDGDVYQVNLTFKLKGQAGDAFSTYMALREKARSGGCAFLRFADEDILSFSPELFFRVRGRRISARPMKGTTARGASVDADVRQRLDLISDDKQRAENLMIVDLLRNDLARVARQGSVEVSDLFSVETYPRFHTLTSGIDAELKDEASFSSIVRSLFPCGSVTGAPKIRAMEIIREVEDGPRGVYCGAIGYVAREAAAFNVGIRTLVLRDGRAEMGVGGGIVWDSEPAGEYAECLLKARFLTEAHEPFRLIETMRWVQGEGFHLLERHLARLAASSRYFGFRLYEAAVRKALSRAVQALEGVQRVRLTLGLAGDVEVGTEPITLPAPGMVWSYAFAAARTDSRDPRFHHKTTLRALYDEELAVQRAATGCDEVVFLNERGEVTEGSRTTLFVERDGVWLTPPLASGVLDGCLRREMIETGAPRVEERVLFPDDLGQGTVWFGNALRGLMQCVPAAPSLSIAQHRAIG